MAEKTKKSKLLRRKGQKNLILAVASSLGVGLVVVLFVLAIGENEQSPPAIESELESDFNSRELSEEVKAYEPLVRQELEEHGEEQYLDIILALMMQESGGKGQDPMQASESLCGEIGCIDDPQLSIEYGVEHFLSVVEQADGDIQLALQSYNFGSGFLDFVNENGGEYTEELAIEYSQQMYERLSSEIDFRCIREISEELNACYGDVKYVDAVLAYYEDAQEHTDEEFELSLEE